MPSTTPYRVLCLDGGGAKGFYTLGVLHEIEALAHKPLCECFDLVFGTSTGAIIASLIALGKSVAEIHTLYQTHVPRVMTKGSAADKSAALEDLAKEVFEDTQFTAVKTGIGIVAARWATEVPMVFKADPRQAHGRASTFAPGFGVSMADAVVASCSAYPFFNRKTVVTSMNEEVLLIDGGYCANNPTLYAITDALRIARREDIRVVSLGVGEYPDPSRWGFAWIVRKFFLAQLLQKTLNINTQSMDQLRELLFKDIPTARISNAYTEPEMATDLMEHDLKKLSVLHQRGRESFAEHEERIRRLLFE